MRNAHQRAHPPAGPRTRSVTLRSRLGTAAGLTVDEGGRPRFTRWMPFPRAAVSPGIAPSDQAATDPTPSRRTEDAVE
jgi:hypothetical protein